MPRKDALTPPIFFAAYVAFYFAAAAAVTFTFSRHTFILIRHCAIIDCAMRPPVRAFLFTRTYFSFRCHVIFAFFRCFRHFDDFRLMPPLCVHGRY